MLALESSTKKSSHDTFQSDHSRETILNILVEDCSSSCFHRLPSQVRLRFGDILGHIRCNLSSINDKLEVNIGLPYLHYRSNVTVEPTIVAFLNNIKDIAKVFTVRIPFHFDPGKTCESLSKIKAAFTLVFIGLAFLY